MTQILVIMTAVALVMTKWLDCISTSRRISHIGQEQNGLARNLMQKMGMKQAIWLIFFIHMAIVALSLWVLYQVHDQAIWEWLFIILGTGISVIQAAVAESNHRGRLNMISRLVLKWMRR
jgi:hypothetical protein